MTASGTGVFADHALELQKEGFAVLPAEGKSPLVGGWNNWRQTPRESAVRAWAKKFPQANIAYLAEQSGLIVADVDDLAAESAILELFGDTPGKVRTRRGKHFLYSASQIRIPANATLRRLGINADLKYGTGFAAIVMAPPSIHPAGGTYSWEYCEPSIRKEVPPFRVLAFKKLLERLDSDKNSEARWRPIAKDLGFRNSSRGLGLNDFLCGKAAYCDTLEEVLDVARTWNEDLPTLGIPSISDIRVVKIATAVWEDVKAEKITGWFKAGSAALAAVEEIKILSSFSARQGPDAYTFLTVLRANHGGRTKPFCITPKAMAEAGVIEGWTRERFENARDVLLGTGFIVCVREFSSRELPALYQLFQRNNRRFE